MCADEGRKGGGGGGRGVIKSWFINGKRREFHYINFVMKGIP